MYRLAAFLAALLCMASAGQAEGLISYAQMRAEVPDTWRETIETVNGPVTIDVAVHVPERKTLPIWALDIIRFDDAALEKVFPGAKNDYLTGEHTRVIVKMGDYPACKYPLNVDECEWIAWNPEAEYAEDAQESRQDVEAFVLDKLGKMTMQESTSYEVIGVMANSRTRNKKNEPVNEHGDYLVTMKNRVNGVSIMDMTGFNQDNQQLYGPHTERPQVNYYDRENFWFTLDGYQAAGMLAEDCAVLPFAAVQQEIKGLITSGFLRRIYRLELCYMPMWSDDGQNIVTLPVWVAQGEWHERASDKTDPEPVPYYLRAMGGYTIIIPVQTGRMIDYADAGANRWKASTYFAEGGW